MKGNAITVEKYLQSNQHLAELAAIRESAAVWKMTVSTAAA